MTELWLNRINEVISVITEKKFAAWINRWIPSQRRVASDTWYDCMNLAFGRLIVTQSLRTLFLGPIFHHYLQYECAAVTLITYLLSTILMSILSESVVKYLELMALETLFNYSLLASFIVVLWSGFDMTKIALDFGSSRGRLLLQSAQEWITVWYDWTIDNVSSYFDSESGIPGCTTCQGFMEYFFGQTEPSQPRLDFRAVKPERPISAPEIVRKTSATRIHPSSVDASRRTEHSFLRVTRHGTVYGQYPFPSRQGRQHHTIRSASEVLSVPEDTIAEPINFSVAQPSPTTSVTKWAHQPASMEQQAQVNFTENVQMPKRTTRSGNAFGYYQVGDENAMSIQKK